MQQRQRPALPRAAVRAVIAICRGASEEGWGWVGWWEGGGEGEREREELELDLVVEGEKRGGGERTKTRSGPSGARQVAATGR